MQYTCFHNLTIITMIITVVHDINDETESEVWQ